LRAGFSASHKHQWLQLRLTAIGTDVDLMQINTDNRVGRAEAQLPCWRGILK
jgi:hypothetical protein